MARRYQPILELGSGGMATVHVGAARGAMGFRQLVAIKQPHPELLRDPDHRRELLREAALASLIHHANVVDVRDVDAEGDSLALVMDYVEGGSLAELLALAKSAGTALRPAVVLRIALDACAGLHAAHEVVDRRGRKVELIHRDVSPGNILVGLDGVARVSDFGVAKARRSTTSSSAAMKGKLGYSAPEHLETGDLDRRFDVFAMAATVWEALAGRQLFVGDDDEHTVANVLAGRVPPISTLVDAPKELDAVLARALATDRGRRHPTVLEFAMDLERAASAKSAIATHAEVASAVSALVGPKIEARRRELERFMIEDPSFVSNVDADLSSSRARRAAQSEPPPATVGSEMAHHVHSHTTMSATFDEFITVPGARFQDKVPVPRMFLALAVAATIFLTCGIAALSPLPWFWGTALGLVVSAFATLTNLALMGQRVVVGPKTIDVYTGVRKHEFALADVRGAELAEYRFADMPLGRGGKKIGPSGMAFVTPRSGVTKGVRILLPNGRAVLITTNDPGGLLRAIDEGRSPTRTRVSVPSGDRETEDEAAETSSTRRTTDP